MKTFKKKLIGGILLALASMGFFACNTDENANLTESGKLRMHITDSPIDAENVSAVVIAITEIEVNGPNGWETIITFEESESLNLLDFQGGETFFLGEEELAIGEYKQIRLHLDAAQQNQGNLGNPGCYIEFTDGTQKPLFVPSGSQTGYAVVGDFEIAAEAVTAITIDFDVRKSVVEAGNSGNYILKPTLRLLVNSDAAMINGSISNYAGEGQLVIYAYEAGTYDESELEPNFDGQLFTNAVSSAKADENGNFKIAFLESGTFEIVVTEADENGLFTQVLHISDELSLSAGQSTEITIEL